MPAPPKPKEFWLRVRCTWESLELPPAPLYPIPMRSTIWTAGPVNYTLVKKDMPPLFSGKPRVVVALWWEPFGGNLAMSCVLKEISGYGVPSRKKAALILTNDLGGFPLPSLEDPSTYEVMLHKWVVVDILALLKAGKGCCDKTVKRMLYGRKWMDAAERETTADPKELPEHLLALV